MSVAMHPTQPLVIIADDEDLGRLLLAESVAEAGLQSLTFDNGLDALAAALDKAPTLVLLDVDMPGMDGFTVCETLRKEGNDVPILFLTARAGQGDRLHGLELGGDDYLGKPFELRELILRVRAILRRTEWFRAPSPAGDVLLLGEARVDFRAYTAALQGRTLELSPKETMILRCLAERPGEVVSRAEILDRVWGYDAFPTSRTIDNFIVRLRRLLEPDPRNPRYNHTVRGTGYRLTP
jgi:two-component system alkaline phosphatase synthesis response regulator PhoP